MPYLSIFLNDLIKIIRGHALLKLSADECYCCSIAFNKNNTPSVILLNVFQELKVSKSIYIV